MYFDFDEEAFEVVYSSKGKPGLDGAAIDAFLAADTPAGTTLLIHASETTTEVPVERTVMKREIFEMVVEEEEQAADGAA